MTTKLTRKQQQILDALLFARKEVWGYYKQNKQQLPNRVSVHRDEIVSLVLSGTEVEQAFKKVLTR